MSYNILDDMSYIEIPLIGERGAGLVTLTDGDYDGEWFSTGFRWILAPTGHVMATYSKGKTRIESNRPIYLHHLVLPPRTGFWRVHLDGDLLNNRSCNVVYMTSQQSALTRKQRTYSPLGSNKLGYRGVARAPGGLSYYSSVRGKYGRPWPTALLAAQDYDRRAYAIWGERAVLNFEHKEN